MSTRIPVAILGGSGYTAIELIKILLRHPHVRIAAITSRQVEPISDLHPSLTKRLDLRCEPFNPDELKAKGVQAAFGCLPHGTSMETVPLLLERGIRVIDLSADYRLRDPEVYRHWYRETHLDPANLAHAVYGLPELDEGSIEKARLIANPGCYPQTAILGLAPLVAQNLIELDDIVVDSKSGVSGAGRSPKLTTLFPECNESVAAYSVGSHRHTPEIEQALSKLARRSVSVLFTPHLIPMDRGIFSTIYAKPIHPMSETELIGRFDEFYGKQPFIRIRTGYPSTKDTVGTNYVDLAPKVAQGRFVILACEDNLVRGASGVAVQNFNRMFGFAETTGLAD